MSAEPTEEQIRRAISCIYGRVVLEESRKWAEERIRELHRIFQLPQQGALSEEQRQALGEALSAKLHEMQDDGSAESTDWCDSRNMDEVLDLIEKTLKETP